MSMSESIVVDAFNLSVERMSAAKLTAAQKRALARLTDDFKRAFNTGKVSAWVAYKLACCSAAQQNALHALYVSQSERLTTADVDAVKRNAYANNAERVDFYALARNADAVKSLRNNVARIVVRARRSTESYEEVDANANALASEQLDSIARDAAQRAAEVERVAALNVAVSLEAQRAAVAANAARDAALEARATDALVIAELQSKLEALSAASATKRTNARARK